MIPQTHLKITRRRAGASSEFATGMDQVRLVSGVAATLSVGMTKALMSRLVAALVPPGAGADLAAHRAANFVTIEPLSARALSWLVDMTDEEASWSGFDLVVEPCFFPAVADKAIAAGLTFERDALAN